MNEIDASLLGLRIVILIINLILIVYSGSIKERGEEKGGKIGGSSRSERFVYIN